MKTTLDQPGVYAPTFAEVITTYLGRTGCACGCGGQYYKPLHRADDVHHISEVSDGVAKRRLSRLLNAEPHLVNVYDGLHGESIYEYEYSEGRVVRAYTSTVNPAFQKETA